MPSDLEICQTTLKNNRTPLLCHLKLCVSSYRHMWIQTGVRVRKRLNWILTSVTLTFCMDITSVNGNHSWNFMMIRWQKHGKKLDESTARRQLKSPQSLSGRSIHLTLFTKWSWSWSWMTHCHLLCAMSIGPPILRYSYFKIWPWKSMVKVMCVVKAQGHI